MIAAALLENGIADATTTMPAPTVVATTVAAMRGRLRPLLIFAPDGDARAAIQARIAATAAAGYRERDIRVVMIAGDTVSGAADRAAALRRRYRIEPAAFAVVLIGKDGGEKLRSAQPLPADRLFATIDAMPMRKDELHR